MRRSWLAIVLLALLSGCGRRPAATVPLDVPRGYVDRLQVMHSGRLLGFGPFVGYYFKPETAGDFSRVRFVAFNERQFYTRDLPANARLFEGEAVLTTLPDTGRDLPRASRINPVYFADAPAAWLQTRPDPQDEWLHFHSAYDANGPVRTGYWIRHRAVAAFTYDMGGRVDPPSPLYHKVTPGVDRDFGRIIEFDRGPR